jgi:hypothetical protein
MQQGRFRATGMMNNHPQALRKYSVATLITEKVAHFWKAYPGHFSKAPKQMPPLLLELWREQHPEGHEQTALEFRSAGPPVVPSLRKKGSERFL